MEGENHPALSVPAVLNLVSKHVNGRNIHRLASTSREFSRAAVRFDDSLVRSIKELQARQAVFKTQMSAVDREYEQLIDAKENASQMFLGILTAFAPIAADAAPPYHAHGKAVATAYVIRRLVLHPNDGTRDSIRRIALLREAIWTGQPLPDILGHRTPWTTRAHTEITAHKNAMFKRAKSDYEKMKPRWDWWSLDPEETEAFLDRIPEFALHASELITAIDQITPQLTANASMRRNLRRETLKTRAQLSEALERMGNPALGSVPRDGRYILPKQFVHLGQDLAKPPPSTRGAIAKRQKLMNAF